MLRTTKQKKLTKDIILVAVVIAGLVSFFWNPQNINMGFLRNILGAVIGYYIGIEEIPIFTAVRMKK